MPYFPTRAVSTFEVEPPCVVDGVFTRTMVSDELTWFEHLDLTWLVDQSVVRATQRRVLLDASTATLQCQHRCWWWWAALGVVLQE